MNFFNHAALYLFFQNATYPEYLYRTDCGVMCLDFHPDLPNLLVVGLYDGNVCVYDINKEIKAPILKSRKRAPESRTLTKIKVFGQNQGRRTIIKVFGEST